jgi:hypothetical protein
LIESQLFPGYDDISNSIRAMFLFGTPHHGLKTASLYGALSQDNTEGRKLFHQLEESSEFLENQKEILSKIWNSYTGKLFTFYETCDTKQLTRVCI